MDRLRHLIREILLNEYDLQQGVRVYHRSTKKFSAGDILTPQNDPSTGKHRYESRPIEKRMEAMREKITPDAPSRMSCVFGSFTPHSRFLARGRLYIIEPIGQTFVTDSTLIDRMNERETRIYSDLWRYDSSAPSKEMLARKINHDYELGYLIEDYWKGAEPTKGKLADLEVLMPKARVVAAEKSTVDAYFGDTVKIPAGVALKGRIYIDERTNEGQILNPQGTDWQREYVPLKDMVDRLRSAGADFKGIEDIRLRGPIEAKILTFQRTVPGEWERRQGGGAFYARVQLNLNGVGVTLDPSSSIEFYDLVRKGKIRVA